MPSGAMNALGASYLEVSGFRWSVLGCTEAEYSTKLLFCKDRPLPELLAPHFPNAEDLRAIVDAARATADLGKVRHRIGSVNLVAHSC